MTKPKVDSPLDQEKPWQGRTRGGYWGNWIFIQLVRYFGLRAAYLLLVPVAFYFVFFAPAARKASQDYWERIEGRPLGLFKRYWKIYWHFFTFGQILLDRVAILGGQAKKFEFQIEGEQALYQALEKKKGAILVSAHFGNWEGAAHLLGKEGYKVHIVAYSGEVQHIQKLFSKHLKEKAFHLIPMDGSMDATFRVLQALSQGDIVAIHGDRSFGPKSKTLAIPFLGSFAKFPIGPYLFSLASGAPIIHTFTLRIKSYHYFTLLYPPLYIQCDSQRGKKEVLEKGLTFYTERLSEWVKKYPFQWCNFYSFWQDSSKKKIEGEGNPLESASKELDSNFQENRR